MKYLQTPPGGAKRSKQQTPTENNPGTSPEKEFYVVNSEDVIEYANSAILKIRAAPLEKLIGTNVLDLTTYIEHGISEKISSQRPEI